MCDRRTADRHAGRDDPDGVPPDDLLPPESPERRRRPGRVAAGEAALGPEGRRPRGGDRDARGRDWRPGAGAAGGPGGRLDLRPRGRGRPGGRRDHPELPPPAARPPAVGRRGRGRAGDREAPAGPEHDGTPLPRRQRKTGGRGRRAQSGRRGTAPTRPGKPGAPYLRNLSSSALTSSAWVQHRPWPAPSMATYSLPGMSSAVRGPQASMGRMRSFVPCSTRTGMSILGRSARKSVCQVGTHAIVPSGEALTARFHASWTASGLISLPRVSSRLKKFLFHSVKYAARSAVSAAAIWSKTSCGAPFGVSGVLSRYGGTPEIMTARRTRADPYRPR